MKNSINLLFACFVLGFIFVSTSCSKKNNDDPVGCNWALEVQAQSQALSDAIAVYGADPTTANCIAFVNAYQNYLDELEDHIGCATIYGNQAELQAAIDQAQDELNNIQC